MSETTLTDTLAATGWTLSEDGKAIAKTFRFGDFRMAIGWMVRASFEAEALNHHPEWFNVYNRIEVRLTTHDTGGLSPLDLTLAAALDAL